MAVGGGSTTRGNATRESLASLTLMAESAESNRLMLVKPRSTCVITSKTEPTTPNDPLDQVNAHLWSTLGQRHGQTPPKP
jgi:hypothetical protein